MTISSPRLGALLLTTSLFGCVDQSQTTNTSDQIAGESCPVSSTRIDPSLIVTDAAVLQRFGFARTMQQVLSSSGASSSETTTQLYQQWMSTFGPTDCTNPKVDPNHYGEVCPRTHEFKLASVDPTDPSSLVQFEPIALTNRFDLAPTSGANCGEYRILYAMHSTDPNILGRGFYIFEAALPNPNPAQKLEGCLPIAEFWQSLSLQPTTASVADKLEAFYYLGTAIKGVGPVVDAHNYGFTTNGGAYTAGQMRSNMFIDANQWHLREFKTDLTCIGTDCTLAIDHVTTKTNPASQLFDGTATLAPEFLTDFPKQVVALASTDISTIGMTIANDNYNTYESVSELSNKVLYDQFTDTALQNAIQGVLTKKGIALQVGDILRRASTQTCAGCHQLSTIGNEAQLGGGLVWPASDTFVQVDEQSKLSTALTQFFLPHRQAVLDDFIDAHCCGGGSDVDDGLTVGGSQVGASN
jgi:hypothetical protein